MWVRMVKVGENEVREGNVIVRPAHIRCPSAAHRACSRAALFLRLSKNTVAPSTHIYSGKQAERSRRAFWTPLSSDMGCICLRRLSRGTL